MTGGRWWSGLREVFRPEMGARWGGVAGGPTGPRRLPRVVPAVLAALMLAGCGAGAAQHGSSSGAGGAASPATSSGSTATPSSSAASSPAASSAPSSGAAPSPAAKAYPVKVSYVSAAVSDLPFYIGQSEGIFVHNGVDVTMVRGELAADMAALANGEVQFMNNGSLAIEGASKGLPFRIVFGIYRESPWRLVGKKSIASLADMRGHTVGSDPPGGATYAYLQAGLQKAGLSIKDVRDLPLGGTRVTYAALISGKIDSAVLSPPTDINAASKGFHEIAFLGGDLQVPFLDLTTTTGMVSQHRQAVVDTIRGLWQSIAWERAHPAASAALIEQKLHLSPAVARQALGEMVPLLTKTGEETSLGVQQDIQLLGEAQKTHINLTPAAVVDYGPLHEALAGSGAAGAS